VRKELFTLFSMSTYQCTQLQNLLCACNILQSHKLFNICHYNILNVITHVQTYIYAQTHINKSLNNVCMYIHT
jgi:hypothetical protein